LHGASRRDVHLLRDRIVTRTHVEGMVGRVFQAAGVALPSHMWELTNQTT
jgi:hypothetical protein